MLRFSPAILLLVLGCAPASPRSGSLTPDQGTLTALPDTLRSLEAGLFGTCITTSAGAAYCWGNFGKQQGQVYRIIGIDSQPVSLISLGPSWGGLCGLTVTREMWCDPPFSRRARDSTGGFSPLPPACYDRTCVAPLSEKGELPAGTIRQVTRGSGRACAIGPDAAAYCLSERSMSQPGSGMPVRIGGNHRFAQLKTFRAVTCGITLGEGAVYCWGEGRNGATGDSTAMRTCGRPQGRCETVLPIRIVLDSLPGQRRSYVPERFVDIAVTYDLACAVTSGGAVYCWGDNYRCALGRCGMSSSFIARQVQMPGRVVEIGVGHWFACARSSDDRVFCWGENTEGQLGSLVSVNAGADGLPPNYRDSSADRGGNDACFMGGRCSPAPVEIASNHRWAALSVGPSHACAIARDDGGVYCWGGRDVKVLGTDAHRVPCVNRSAQWADVLCQPFPVRVPGLPVLAAPPSRVPEVASGRGAPSTTEIQVNQNEVRIVLPIDTTGAWGWPPQADRQQWARYWWSAGFDGMDGPVGIRFTVLQSDSAGRSFSSLESFRAAGAAALSLGHDQETVIKIGTTVQDDRIILTLRDSVTIRRTFGTRPRMATLWFTDPDGGRPSYRPDSAPIRYVDPQIPEPDSATRAEAAQGRRRFEASISSITRHISGGAGYRQELWLALGDSAHLMVDENHCHYDVCGMGNWSVSDSGWSVVDSTVVHLDAGCRLTRGLVQPGRCFTAYGIRLGRTTIRVRGIHGDGDTMPSFTPPPSAVERAVIVGKPVARVFFTDRPDSAVVGAPVTLRVTALDREGREVPGVPVQVTVDLGSHRMGTDGTARIPIQFDGPGLRQAVASFNGLADTLMINVVPSGEKK